MMALQMSEPPSPLSHDSPHMSFDQERPLRPEQHAGDPQRGFTPDNTTNAKPQPADVSIHRIGGAIREITWALLCLSLPMLVLTAVFIGLVYKYEISNINGASDLLGRTSSLQNGSAYYIDYSATRLVTVSSWTSTVASFTSTFVMVLVSYPIAKSFLRKSVSGATESLPTAYQLSLIIGLLQGGLGPLWTWLQYHFWKGRARQPWLVWMALLSMLGGTALSLAILGADTWLHVVTTTVELDVLLSPASQPTSVYGRSLAQECYNQTFTTGGTEQCIGRLQIPNQLAFYSASEATKTNMNLSLSNAALSCDLDNQNFAYLTAAQRQQDLDFQTQTFAMSTTCSPASKICHLQQNHICLRDDGCPLGLVQGSLEMAYNCSPSLSGNLNNGTGSAFGSDGSSSGSSSNIGFFLQMFRKQNFSDPIGTASTKEYTPNPFYFTVGGAVSTSDDLANDPEAIQSDEFFNKAFLFNCTTAVYQLDYTSINDTVVDGTYKRTNDTLSNNVGWTLLNAQALTHNYMESAFISGAQQSNTSQDFADFFAREFSRGTISMLAGITVGSANTAEQTRESRLVTRLPKAPFFVLIILNLLYAVLGIILAAVALASHPRRTRNIQARLSTQGLVAALLEPGGRPFASNSSSSGVESVFAEYFNKGNPQEGTRVMLVDSETDNRVFEKISPDNAALLHDKSVALRDLDNGSQLHFRGRGASQPPAQRVQQADDRYRP